MEYLSLIGIFVGLIVMIILAYKGHSIIWVAPLSAFIVVLFSMGAGLGDGRTLLSTYTTDYMQGTGQYFISWFPTFLLGAIYGKVMDMTGAARSLAKMIVKVIGPKFVLVAILLPSIALTYGGVSLFVCVFIMYPMGYEIFRAANLPRTLLPAVLVVGQVGITMTHLPGSPQIQNLIPTEYYGTTAFAEPVYGIISAVVLFVPCYVYLSMKVNRCRRDNLCFVEDPLMAHLDDANDETPSWHWLSGLVPLIVVFLSLNVFKLHIVVSLILGILVCYLFNLNQLKMMPTALTEGAKSSITAMMNTACAVGFGSVIKVVPGFVLLTALLLGKGGSPFSLLFSEAVATGVLSGATGSASGGLSIALSAFADKYLELASAMNITPELLHRVACIGAGALDKLPHNGALITLLAVSHCTHKDSYGNIFVVAILLPVITEILMIAVWSFFVL